MRANYYPVVTVTKPGSVDYDKREKLGSKEKFWFRHNDGRLWLFKYPRRGSGEHWAEKIVAEIAKLIGVRCAEVQLAKCGDDLGMQSLSFTEPGWTRVHGNEIMAEAIAGYDEHLRFGQRDHSVRNIVTAVAKWADRHGLDRNSAMSDLVSYALLDGLTGNTDRHHENWMFYYDPHLQSFRLAPSYDHGSSLGRELQDTGRRTSRSRSHILQSGGVLNYLMNRNSRGSVYVNRHNGQSPPPLSLALLICRWQPSIVQPVLEQINSVPDSQFQAVIDKVPPAFMSGTAKEFAYQMVTTSKAQLLRRTIWTPFT